MTVRSKSIVLSCLLPVVAAVMIMGYYYQHRRSMMSELAKSGVSAVFDGGTVSHEDIREYFLYPPVEEDSILQALEFTPEDVADLDQEEAVRLKEPTMQLLLRLIIQHLSVVKYLDRHPMGYSEKEYQDAVKIYRHSLMADRMEQELLSQEAEIQPEEMMRYYIRHRDEFHQEGKRLSRHIAIANTGDEETVVSAIWRRIEEGEDFGVLIQKYSTSESQNRNGVLGWHPKGALHQKIEAVLWSMDIGEITGPIRVNEYSHFLHLIDVQEKGLLDFESSQPLIREALEEDLRARQVYEQLGISPHLIQAGNVEASLEYQTKLLERAYDQGLDEDEDILKKVAVFALYKRADLMFDRYTQSFEPVEVSSNGLDMEWKRDHQALEQLLEEMNFQFLVRFDLPEKESAS